MGWLDDIARGIENGVKEVADDAEKIVDRILGLED